MESLKDKNGEVIPHGSLITWKEWDSDDFTTWTFLGIVRDYTQRQEPFYAEIQYVTYLGGGADFGGAIGEQIGFQEVMKQAENNDTYDVGITVLGCSMDVVRILNREYNL